MDWYIIIIPPVVVVGLIIALVAFAAPRMIDRQAARTRQLQAEYGERYFRATNEFGNERGETILTERRKDEEKSPRRNLSPDEVTRYVAKWDQIRGRFDATPSRAVDEADLLLADLLARRGLLDGDGPSEGSAPHAAERYREAHDIAERNRADPAPFEDLQRAMHQYEVVFDEVI